MNINHLVVGSMLVCATTAWGEQQPVKKVDAKKAHAILEAKCTNCHTVQVIDAAVASRKDMAKIQKAMEGKGASLSASEQEVLGIYWKQTMPLKKSK